MKRTSIHEASRASLGAPLDTSYARTGLSLLVGIASLGIVAGCTAPAMPPAVAEADAVLDAGAVAGRPDLHGRFTIVEGRVSRLGHGRVNIYLNFGTISRHDLSVTVQKRALQRLEASGMTWSSIEGRRVRVRGIVAGTGRPTLAVGRPEEIERLD